jgi:hypothetical protein
MFSKVFSSISSGLLVVVVWFLGLFNLVPAGQTGLIGGPGTANPISAYNTIEELSKAVGFTVKVPAVLSDSATYSAIGGKTAQILFHNNEDDRAIIFRQARGWKGSISGVYTSYSNTVKTKRIPIVTLQGNGDLYYLATWTYRFTTNSLYFPNGTALSNLSALAAGVI